METTMFDNRTRLGARHSEINDGKQKIKIHEYGILIQSRRHEKVILWDDVQGVHLDSLVRIQTSPKVPIPIFIPLPTVTIIGYTTIGGGTKIHHKTGYVFHLPKGEIYELNGGIYIIALNEHIERQVMPRLIEDTVRAFQAGAAIPLTEMATYSQYGIEGCFLKSVGKTSKEIPLDLPWEQISGLMYANRNIYLGVGEQPLITIPTNKIINSSAFISVLHSLHVEGRLPEIRGI
jgi:hypothetical protein